MAFGEPVMGTGEDRLITCWKNSTFLKETDRTGLEPGWPAWQTETLTNMLISHPLRWYRTGSIKIVKAMTRLINMLRKWYIYALSGVCIQCTIVIDFATVISHTCNHDNDQTSLCTHIRCAHATMLYNMYRSVYSLPISTIQWLYIHRTIQVLWAESADLLSRLLSLSGESYALKVKGNITAV